MKKPKVIAVVGPTASGKSSLSLFLAQKIRGEIISADSRQIYRGMSVISRAPSEKERRATHHHLVGIASPKKQFTADDFTRLGKKACVSILQKAKTPIVVGGTGFYADALLRGLSLPKVPPDKKLRTTLGKKSSAELFVLLKKLDAKSAKRVDPKNKVRLIRAIEITKALGSIPPLSTDAPYEVLWLGVTLAGHAHTRAIRKGVGERLASGMAVEAKKLRATLPKKRFSELGFEFDLLAHYLDKKISRETLVDLLVRGEERYAKRQMRWFTRNKDIRWISSKAEALRLVKEFLSS